MRQLTSLDAQFLAFEDGRNHGHVSVLGIYEPQTAPNGRLALDDVRTVIEERLHLLPPFRWRLAPVPFGLDHPYWVEDPDFDLEFHLRELALPAPGDDRQLADQVARIHARPLDRSHPLWELYVIQGLVGDRVAVLTKVHHAAVDGVSGAELLGILLDPSPDSERRVTPAEAPRRTAMPGEAEMLARGLLGVARQPVRALRSGPRALPHLDTIPTVRAIPGAGGIAAVSARLSSVRHDGGVLERVQRRAPRTRFNGRISAHRRFAFASLPLSDVKALKDAFGVTVNDVVLALCAGALRRRLLAGEELPTDPLLAMVPVSVRTAEQAGTFGNRVSSMIVALPTDEANPSDRIARVAEAMGSAKERHRMIPATVLQDANEFIPPALLTRAARVVGQLAVRDPFAPPTNVVVSNVPGAKAPLFLAGARLEAQYPVSVLLDGVGLNITILSYRGWLDVGIVGDRELMPDVWELIDDLRAELAELRALLNPEDAHSTQSPRRRNDGKSGK